VDNANGGQISTFIASSNWSQFSNVGTYSTTLTGNAANNYLVSTTASGGGATTPNFNSVAVVGGVLTVTPATLTITATNDSKVYGATTTTTNAVTYTGVIGTGGASSFTTSGLYSAHDSITSVSLSSSGAVAAATVNGGPYAIAISNAQGSGLSNYVISYINGSMAVTPKTLTITANADSKVYGTTTTTSGVAYVGNSVTGVTGYSVTGLVNGDTLYDVTLNSAGALVGATVGGGALTGANAGKYAITPSSATGSPGISSNYSLSYVPGALTITPAILTITANNDSKIYGSTTTSGGLTYLSNSVTGTAGFTAIGLVNGDTVNNVTLTSLGAAINASVAGSNYVITPSAATGSGIANNYTVNYVNGAMTVTPKALIIAADNTSMSYGASSLPTLTYTNSGLVNGDTLTGTLATLAQPYSGVAGSASNAGTYAITQGTLSAGGNYTVTYIPATLTVNPVALTVTANNISTVYGVATPLATSQFTSGGLVNGDAISSVALDYNSSSTVPGTVNVGTYANAITVAAISGINNANYLITSVPSTLTVTPAALTVTANTASMTYGANSLPSLSYATVGLVNGDTLSGALATTASAYISGSAGSASNIGTYAITQGTLSASSNYNLSFTPGVLTVTAASLTITGNTQTVVYGSGANLSSSAFTVTGLVNGDSVSAVTALFSGNASVGATTNAGSYANSIVISSATGTRLANYNIAYAPGSLTVTPATLNVTANNQSMLYGASNIPNLSYTSSGLVNGDTLAGALSTLATPYSGIAGSASAVGSYAITQGTLVASNNYILNFTAGTLTVTPAALTITANNQSGTYGSAITSLGSSAFSSIGLVNGDGLTGVTLKYQGATNVAATTNVGSYNGPAGIVASSVVPAVGTNLSNYNITYINGSLTINPAVLTVAADSQVMNYGANNLPNLTYVLSGLKNGDVVSGALATTATAYNGSAGSASNVGAYPITQGTLTAGSNYTVSYTGANLNVTPAALTIAANNQSTVYGTPTNLGTTAFTSTGLLNGDSITGVSLLANGNAATSATTNAGAATISASLASGTRLSNYIISYVPAILTVAQKPISVVANSAVMNYADSVLPALTYQAVTGLVNGDAMSGALATTATAYNGLAGSASNAGSYVISQGTLTAGSNYLYRRNFDDQ
jgi:hypothetical protein